MKERVEGGTRRSAVPEPSLEQVLEMTGDGILALGDDLRIEHASEDAVRMLDAPDPGLLERSFTELFDLEYRPGIEQVLSRVLQTGRSGRIGPCPYRRKGKWLEIRACPMHPGLAVLCRDVSHSVVQEQALHRRANRLRLLNDVGRILGSSLELKDVYRKLREFVASTLPTGGLLVSRYTPEDQLIRCEYAWVSGNEIDPATLPPVTLNSDGRGMQSQVIVTGRSMIFENVVERVKDPETTNYVVTPEGIQEHEPVTTQSAMMVPILVDGVATGAVQVMSDAVKAYDQDDLDILEGIVNVLSGALRNARLYETATREIRERELFEARLKVAMQNARIMVFQQDLDMRYIWIENPLVPNDQDRIGKTPQETFDPETAELVLEKKRHVIKTGEGLSFEMTIPSESGPLYLRQRLEPFRDANGEVVGLIGAIIDVSDVRLAEEELKRANLELEQRVRERTEELQAAVRELEGFTYTVSHDLRAPLRAISATSSILRHDYGGQLSSDAREYLDRQAQAAEKMGKLIDELLKLSRISRQPLTRTEFNISELAEQVIGEIVAETGSDRARFQVQPGLSAKGDASLIRFVLLNLLHNAVKFSPPSGQISFGIREGSFYVCDQGIGFEQDYAEKIFQPFERLVTDRQYPGTGIGLANVKRIVERHGGTVWAESKLEEGSCFYFVLA